jgi:thioester reductase-like protein
MTILMTGFPGFLGGALLPRLLARTDDTAVCVVQPKYAALAEERVARLETEQPSMAGRIRLVPGDITLPQLGLEDPAGLAADVTELWHLAAVYDLAVARDLAMRVNVEGTRYVLDVAARCPRLERFHYFSTCYVSGRYAGPFGEDDLEVGARFNNSYEETKHLAESTVRARMAEGLPATIYRPSIVLGEAGRGRRRSTTVCTSPSSSCCGNPGWRHSRSSAIRRPTGRTSSPATSSWTPSRTCPG